MVRYAIARRSDARPAGAGRSSDRTPRRRTCQRAPLMARSNRTTAAATSRGGAGGAGRRAHRVYGRGLGKLVTLAGSLAAATLPWGPSPQGPRGAPLRTGRGSGPGRGRRRSARRGGRRGRGGRPAARPPPGGGGGGRG